MRVLVTGGYGLIGSACLVRLHRDGHELAGAGRAIDEARLRLPFARWIEADFNCLTRSDDWLALLTGFDAVVNCVGVLQDGARDDVRRVQVDATIALFEACARVGLRRIVHISAVGASRTGPTEFARSKGMADENLAGRDLDWAILRPALVLAPAVYGGTAMLRGLAGLPWVVPIVDMDARAQVVSVDDVTETVARCLASGAPMRVRWDLAHPKVHTLADIVVALRRWAGFVERPLWQVPRAVGTAVRLAADALGWLGWRSPARSTSFKQLATGAVGEPAAWIAATGIRPKSLEDILAQSPATLQDRWFARLYWLKPLAIASIAVFWAVTGLITIGPGRDAAAAQLAATGFPRTAVNATVVLGGLFDVALGLALLVRRWARPVLLTMLAVTPFYLLAGTLLAPQLWLDPLGPLLKVVPLLVAMLFTLAIMDER